MPWKHLQSWFTSRARPQIDPPMPLTLVTLTSCASARADEVAFYTQAEFNALVEWAMRGRLVLAFAAVERDELTLICTDPIEEMRASIAELPLVAAGLATADVRLVMSMRLVPDTGFRPN